jgi:hypothetical protein
MQHRGPRERARTHSLCRVSVSSLAMVCGDFHVATEGAGVPAAGGSALPPTPASRVDGDGGGGVGVEAAPGRPIIRPDDDAIHNTHTHTHTHTDRPSPLGSATHVRLQERCGPRTAWQGKRSRRRDDRRGLGL